jgi:hypothetical protein
MVSSAHFYVILLVLYAIECTARVRLGDLSFVHHMFLRRYSLCVPARLSGGTKLGWILLNPFWPQPPALRASCTSFLLCETGIALYDPRTNEYRLVEFASMEQTYAKGDSVILTRQDSIECLSPTEAVTLSSLIDGLRRIDSGNRSRAIEACESKLYDTTRIRAEIDRFARGTRPIYFLSGWGTFLILAGFPLLNLALGFEIGVLLFLILAVITSTTAAVFCHRLIGEVDPRASKLARVAAALRLALYPISLPRCLDEIYLRHFPAFESVALAHVVGGRRLLEQSVQELCARMAEFEAAADSEATAVALVQHRERRTRALAAFLRQVGSNLDEILQAPAARDAGSRSYCPRCFVQFRAATGTCPDCRGVILKPLRPATTAKGGRG